MRKRLRKQRACDEIFVSRSETNGFESVGNALQCGVFWLPPDDAELKGSLQGGVRKPRVLVHQARNETAGRNPPLD
jgi:hypothetical protein